MKDILLRADLPDSVEARKALVTNGLEAGIRGFILRKEDKAFTDMGKMDAIFVKDGKPCDDAYAICKIDDPESQSRTLALAGRKKAVIVETSDWTIIPLENIIAKFRSSGTKIYAVASNKSDAELYLATMEKGVDGVVISVDDPLSISKFRDMCTPSESVELSELEVTNVKQVEMGDRVCIDTCSMMVPGEGMLIGSYSSGLFLIQSESEENGYVASRPFRVNAGAVHSYIYVPGGGTRYLAELQAGDSVSLCDGTGKVRTASVGRCKVEIRPLLLVEATDGVKTYSVVLQNAETIKMVTSGGSESVTKLKPGDKVLAKTESCGRHFGMAVEETITEK